MLGQMIREHREKAGLTQLELAQKLGYESPQFLSLVEREVSKPPYIMLGKLVSIIGIPETKVTKHLTGEFLSEMYQKIHEGKVAAGKGSLK